MKLIALSFSLVLSAQAHANVNFLPNSKAPSFVQEHMAQAIKANCTQITANGYAINEEDTQSQIVKVDNGLVDIYFKTTFVVNSEAVLKMETVWTRANNGESMTSSFAEGCF